MRKIVVFTVLGAMVLFCATAVQAANKNWTGSSGDGLYVTSTNWSTAGVPGSGDVAYFGTSTVPNATVSIRNGDTATASQLNLQATATGTTSNVTLNIANGGVYSSAGAVNLGKFINNTSTINLSGSMTVLNTTVGALGVAAFNVNNGGSLTCTGTTAGNSMYVGDTSTSGLGGTLTVNTGGSVTGSSSLYLARNGIGTVDIEGGTITLTNLLTMNEGLTSANNGTLTIHGGTLNTTSLATARGATASAFAQTSSVSISGNGAQQGLLNLTTAGANIAFGNTVATTLNTASLTVGTGGLITGSGAIKFMSGANTFNMNGGEVDLTASTTNAAMVLLANNASSSATLYLNGGLIKVDNSFNGTAGVGLSAGLGTASVVVKDGVYMIKGDAWAAGGSFNGMANPLPTWLTAANGYTLQYNYDVTNAGYTTIWATVPEPATIGLLGLGSLLFRRRKRA